MELKDLKLRKQILEQELTTVIEQFIKETGLTLANFQVDIGYVKAFGDKPAYLLPLKVKITLDI